ncbi:hypothetical protein SASPL_157600 [Salvia splendens]|uniref:beta-glucosidase n=1 Tax=Salvia splendens TaxID=180675 RepID=A0A8X8YTZ7_SALSN|nr:hypothetical protein SASPL_157600 [Salvia splendens]
MMKVVSRGMKMKMMVMVLMVIVVTEAKEYMKYKDPKQPLNARIRDLMKRMSLEEKIGQMTQIERMHVSPTLLKKYFIGSVLSGAGSSPSPKASAEEWVKMVNTFQKAALSTRLGIPIFYGADATHGNNNVYNATIFPHNIQPLSRGSEQRLHSKLGTGINYNFAPSLAVCRDPRWGQCFESYSEDPKVVRAMTEFIPGLQGDIPPASKKGVPFLAGKKKVAACAKGFVGEGGTVNGIDKNNTELDFHGLLSIHMLPYLDSIRKGVISVMVAYSSWNGRKMHANRDLLTGFLKHKLKFRGFIISSWLGIDRITDPPHSNYSHSIEAGILAGIDIVMLEDNLTEFIDDLTYQVKSNNIPMSRIDDAVLRILRVKFTMGLFENPLADLSLVNQLGSQNHRELSREAVRRSLVLLKNGKSTNQPLLPLKKDVQKVLVTGTHADNLGYQCGGWTVEWQGVKDSDPIVGTTVLNAIRKTVDPSTQVVHMINPGMDLVKPQNFSYAIIVVGEIPYAEEKGDSKNLTIIEPGPSTIRNVCRVVRCVVVIISGRPVTIEPYLDKIDALVAAWLPGTEGQGVADVLFGQYGFTGKLPRLGSNQSDQLPMM